MVFSCPPPPRSGQSHKPVRYRTNFRFSPLTFPAENSILITVIEQLFYNCDFLCWPSGAKKRRSAFPTGKPIFLVEEGGFEPPKRNATDLQSAPFGHSGTPPYSVGAGGRIRTPDLLITNQLLYRLSYTSTWRLSNSRHYYSKEWEVCQVKNKKFFAPPLRDIQTQPPAWFCPQCGGEQYQYDRPWGSGGLCAQCWNRLQAEEGM